MNTELLEALTILEEEKNISKDTMMDAIENSLISACKNHFGTSDNIKIIAQVIISVVIPILTYFGLQASDLTTWGKVWDTFTQAVSNPYVVVMAAVSLFNAITDPTTKGIGDSHTALTYDVPKK